MRWANGLLWQHARDYVLDRDTAKTGEEAGIDVKLYPLALVELQRVPPDQRVGPVIVDSFTGQHFKGDTYRRRWWPAPPRAGRLKHLNRRHALGWSPICFAAPADRRQEPGALARRGYQMNLVAGDRDAQPQRCCGSRRR